MERRRYPRFRPLESWVGEFRISADVVVHSIADEDVWVRSSEPVRDEEPISLEFATPSGIVAARGHVTGVAPLVQGAAVRHDVRLRLDAHARTEPCPLRTGALAVLWRTRGVTIAEVSRGGVMIETTSVLMPGAAGTLLLTTAAGRYEDAARVVWSRPIEGASGCHSGLELLPIFWSPHSLRDAVTALDPGVDL